ncbi:MAG: bifunctional UDP-N-acetylmuramoyl-tripeptide:D-alanyl-D-alanine ligase/alanine racemase [Cytophagales bacterium]|nr:bifunctional UDP-N-acetylmuramoyl-tripeptide:D-alanyl-D-alanine ligase/alanine racemase [Cytophagales bacterium]
MLSFRDLPALTGGQLLAFAQDAPVEHLLLDSRKPAAPVGTAFFAIRGERHDGHRFVAELYGKGVRQFVVEDPEAVAWAALPEANVLGVESAVAALQAVAAHHRRQFSIPVIGITGSNGKTIVKEWLAGLLDGHFRVVKSPKSYNSQVGVPLSVWEMNGSHTLGIFEAGISRPGEMENLARVIGPTLGIFTNIGPAHDEGFADRAQKVREKALLFTGCATVICCRDHEAVYGTLRETLPAGVQLFTWSRTGESPVRLRQVRKRGRESDLDVEFGGAAFSLPVPFADEASVENVMHAITTLLHLGLSPEAIVPGVALLQPLSMRLAWKEGVEGCSLIDDSYSNDLAGLSIALDFLTGQGIRRPKTIILSDVLESGLPEPELYGRIARLLRDKGIGRLVGVGEVISRNGHLFGSAAVFFPSTEALLADLPAFRDELILVKGARAFRFERVVGRLQRKTHGTVLEINLDALAHNLHYFRRKLRPHTKVMAMVKAFAYGSGGAEIAGVLQFHRVDYLAVAYADEGAALREKGITLPIMVMNPSAESFGQLLGAGLEPEIYSFKILGELLDHLRRTGGTATIHLKLETGMHRLGFDEADLPQLAQTLREHPEVRVAALFSHLAASDDPQWQDFTREQIGRFREMSDRLIDTLGYRPIRHILNSAGVSHYTDAQFDLVRLGIGLYGVGVNPVEQAQLETVGTLKTTISQIKHLRPGQTVGYGRRGTIERDSAIATLAIGYADGFDRRLGLGKGRVWINGYLAPTIGSVCMDMTMVDITGIPAQEGDEVVVFGAALPVTELARQCGTIPYEIMTGISDRVKRVFYSG